MLFFVWFLSQVNEVVVDYSSCSNVNSPNEPCADLLEKDEAYTNHSDFNLQNSRCICHANLRLEGFGTDSTYIYYGLDNYFQNHRRYVKSRWDPQLRSVQAAAGEDCDPLESQDGKYFAPCGLIANSLFNGLC